MQRWNFWEDKIQDHLSALDQVLSWVTEVNGAKVRTGQSAYQVLGNSCGSWSQVPSSQWDRHIFCCLWGRQETDTYCNKLSSRFLQLWTLWAFFHVEIKHLAVALSLSKLNTVDTTTDMLNILRAENVVMLTLLFVRVTQVIREHDHNAHWKNRWWT